MSMLAEKLRHKLIARDKELLARQTELNAMLDVLKEQARQLRAYEQGDSPKVGDLQAELTETQDALQQSERDLMTAKDKLTLMELKSAVVDPLDNADKLALEVAEEKLEHIKDERNELWETQEELVERINTMAARQAEMSETLRAANTYILRSKQSRQSAPKAVSEPRKHRSTSDMVERLFQRLSDVKTGLNKLEQIRA